MPVIWRQLRLHATYTDFLTEPERPYLPQRFGRAALEYHWAVLRRQLRAHAPLGGAGGRTVAARSARTRGLFNTVDGAVRHFNFYVQMRVLDVRAFWRMENAFNRDRAFDIPGLFLPGVRAMFGVRWFFRD